MGKLSLLFEQRLIADEEARKREREAPLASGTVSNQSGAPKATTAAGGSSGKGIDYGYPVPATSTLFEETADENGVAQPPPPWGRYTERDRDPLLRRLEIPEFNGEEAESWVLRVEQYYEISDLMEEEKMRAVRMCYTGEALSWYRWERTRDPFLSWEQMKRRVLEQFSPLSDTSAGERLLLLRQTGTVKEFCRDFIALASNALEVPDNVLEMTFMIGLKKKIRAGVRIFMPRGLRNMMENARKVEEWSEADDGPEDPPSSGKEKANRGSNGKFLGSAGKLGQGNNNGPNNLNKPKPTTGGANTLPHNRVKPPFRRLTAAEIAERKAKGLCFRCDEKYSAKHCCPHSELSVMMVLDDGSEIEVSECSVELEEEAPCETAEIAELSISSMMGISSSRTIKLKGEIKGETVTVLIDSGATHNFVSTKMAQRLGFSTDRTRGFGVLTAGGVGSFQAEGFALTWSCKSRVAVSGRISFPWSWVRQMSYSGCNGWKHWGL